MAFKQTDIDFFKKYNWVFQPQKATEWFRFYETFSEPNQYWIHDDNKFGDYKFKTKDQNFVGTWQLTSSDFILNSSDNLVAFSSALAYLSSSSGSLNMFESCILQYSAFALNASTFKSFSES